MGQTGLLADPARRRPEPDAARRAARLDARRAARRRHAAAAPAVRSEGLTRLHAGRAVAPATTATRCSSPRPARRRAFPWTRSAGVDQRYDRGRRRRQGDPAGDQLGPFSPAAALQGGPIPLCSAGPTRRRARGHRPRCPPSRRSSSTARSTCARPSRTPRRSPSRIPGAAVVQVPCTGHSVAQQRPHADSSCTRSALTTFFAAARPAPARRGSNPFTPDAPAADERHARDAPRKSRCATVVAARGDGHRRARARSSATRSRSARCPLRVGGLRGGNATVTSVGQLHAHAATSTSRACVVAGTVGREPQRQDHDPRRRRR